MGRALLPPAGEAGVHRPSVAALWDAVDLYRALALLYAVYEFSARIDRVPRDQPLPSVADFYRPAVDR